LNNNNETILQLKDINIVFKPVLFKSLISWARS